jgi:hypothetical protein
MALQIVKKPLSHRQVRQLSSDRTSTWLRSSYFDNVWIIVDTAGEVKERQIDFAVPMADGRLLPDHPKLLATVKELLYWLRSGTYSSMDSSTTHVAYANVLLQLAYGLTARGFNSFSELGPTDIDQICEDAAYGVDGLTRASHVLRKALEVYNDWSEVPTTIAQNRSFNLDSVLRAFHLPVKWAQAEIRSELSVTAARFGGWLLASVADAKGTTITATSILRLTTMFDALFALRTFIEAPTIKFRPFPEGPSQRAIELGEASNRTPIAHPDHVMNFLEGTIRYIVSNADDVVHDYNKVLADQAKAKPEGLPVAVLVTRVCDLVTACYVLIAAFTARRSGEIKLLNWDCVAGNDDDGWWMKIYIEKTSRERTWIPIPSIVAKAVKVLSSFNNRPEPGEEGLLFQYYSPVHKRLVDPSPETHLNSFAKLVGAHEHANDNGEPTAWRWNTRQFRRFFAVLYLYRYRGKKEAISHHLRHFNLDMANDYLALDPDVDRIWLREYRGFQNQIAREIAGGQTVYAGPMGDRLNKLAKRIREAMAKKVQVVSLEMARVLMRSMKKQHLVVRPKPWVTCTCPMSASGCSKAACRKARGGSPDEVGPDFAAAGPTVCPNCPWALISQDNIAYIDKELEAMNGAFKVNEPTIFGELFEAQVISLTQFSDTLKAA